MAGIRIIGLGKSTGDKVVTNDELSRIVDTSDSWIREKSGIRSRYFALNKTNSDMASEAAEKAIEDAGIDKNHIDYLLVATFTPDNFTPGVACKVAGRIGLRGDIIATDINGACSGFIYSCKVAEGLLATGRTAGRKSYALVIGSEKISPLMDMTDRGTCVLFGDGAGAAVIEYSEDCTFGFYGGCEPREDVLRCSREKGTIEMSGQEVYRFAVSKVPDCTKEILKKTGYTPEQVDWFVCHQANERIIDNGARKLSGQENKFYKNLYYYGNTSAASIPLALADMASEGLLEGEKTCVCTGFGAGLTFGSMLIKIKR